MIPETASRFRRSGSEQNQVSSLVPYNDEIGKLGEALFAARIIRFCKKRPWFNPGHLGEKYPTNDFIIRLVLPSSPEAFFFAQVKATTQGYTSAAKQRLIVQVSAQDVRRLKETRAPSYIIGVDVNLERSYIVAITSSSPNHFSSIPTTHPLNCKTKLALWKEVDDYWRVKTMLPTSSTFA